MHTTLKQLEFVQNKINEIINRKQLKSKPEIIVISKTFNINDVKPLLEYGHIHFGENKIQEAEEKWTEIKKKYKNLQLHMVGKLQSNKVKKAVKLFDFIHSLDNKKLALMISKYQKELKKEVKLFIQINLAAEEQKSGLLLTNLDNFYNYCVSELSLNIIGLMCLPPVDINSDKYFKLLKKSSDDLNLNEISMGMSVDFENAVLNGSTFLRLGTLIMGKKNLI